MQIKNVNETHFFRNILFSKIKLLYYFLLYKATRNIGIVGLTLQYNIFRAYMIERVYEQEECFLFIRYILFLCILRYIKHIIQYTTTTPTLT